jgi:hypothetical protein
MPQPSRDALARYNAMREAALADAQHRRHARIPAAVRLSMIDDAALRAWREKWRPSSNRPGGWDWREQRLRLASTVSRFEVTIWSRPLLGGLAIGKPSKGASHLAMQLLEGNAAPTHPLLGFVAECAVEAGISLRQVA